eukprot:gene8011-16404_t
MSRNHRSFEEDAGDPDRVYVMEELIIYCESRHFQIALERFKGKHLHHFIEYAECKSPEDQVQKLEFTDIFNEYQELIEDLLESFLTKHKCTVRGLFQECRDSIEGNFTAIFEEHKHKWFVDILMSWLEYTMFLEEMVTAARDSIQNT